MAYLGNQVLQATLRSQRSYDNPFWDVTVTAEVTGADGSLRRHEAFWDGRDRWRLRVRAAAPGRWDLRFRADPPGDGGLDGVRGHGVIKEPDEEAVEGPFTRHGILEVAGDGRHLAHADGTPFFWLADTAWNALLRAEPADWEHYLTVRRQQGFTATHAILTHWFGCPADGRSEQAYHGSERIRLNPACYQRMDAKVAAAAEHGMLLALVNLWARRSGDPGHPEGLAEADAARLARYQVARYGAYPTVWFLGGDGDYLGEQIDRWRRLGRAVFDDGESLLATLHPAAQQWVGGEFAGESWFSFVGYQSGHRDDVERLNWLQQGPPARAWRQGPPLPVINLEPCYEANKPYNRAGTFTAYDVRKHLYWSLFNAPSAGVSYGHHGIWPWQGERGLPTGHEKSGEAPPWFEVVETPGTRSVTHLKHLMVGLPWWRLRPAQELLRRQPGDRDPLRHVAAARTDDGEAVVVYVPAGDPIILAQLPGGRRRARWYDPRTGDFFPAAGADEADATYRPPSRQDWVLVLTPA